MGSSKAIAIPPHAAMNSPCFASARTATARAITLLKSGAVCGRVGEILAAIGYSRLAIIGVRPSNVAIVDFIATHSAAGVECLAEGVTKGRSHDRAANTAPTHAKSVPAKSSIDDALRHRDVAGLQAVLIVLRTFSQIDSCDPEVGSELRQQGPHHDSG